MHRLQALDLPLTLKSTPTNASSILTLQWEAAKSRSHLTNMDDTGINITALRQQRKVNTVVFFFNPLDIWCKNRHRFKNVTCIEWVGDYQRLLSPPEVSKSTAVPVELSPGFYCDYGSVRGGWHIAPRWRWADPASDADRSYWEQPSGG